MPLDYAQARRTMVDTQVRVNDVTDPYVQHAMRIVPREACCGANAHLAYADAPVEYAPGLFLLRPRDIAKLLQAVRPRAGETALAIAAPYAAAVLQSIGLAVESQEAGASVSGSYDLIITEGAVTAAPQSWLSALKPGGRLGVIERNGAAGSAKVYLKGEEDVGARTVFDAHPALLPGFEPAPSFAL